MTDLAETAALLAEAHPDQPRFQGTRYLEWLYEENPVGAAVQENIERHGERVSHLALVPQRWWSDAGTAMLCGGVNAVTSSGSGRAHFLALLQRTMRETIRRGFGAGYGVTNEASTVITVARSGIGEHGPLPVIVRPAGPGGRAVESRDVDAGWLAGGEFVDLVERADRVATPGWTQQWTAETLAWRLRAPGAAYAVHWDDHVAVITSRQRHRGIPVTVVLKLLALGDGAGRADAGRVVARATRRDRAPAAVYAGFNRRVRLRGLPVPKPVLPAPLNLLVFGARRAAEILHVEPTDQSLGDDEVEFATFELLDFDAF